MALVRQQLIAVADGLFEGRQDHLRRVRDIVATDERLARGTRPSESRSLPGPVRLDGAGSRIDLRRPPQRPGRLRALHGSGLLARRRGRRRGDPPAVLLRGPSARCPCRSFHAAGVETGVRRTATPLTWCSPRSRTRRLAQTTPRPADINRPVQRSACGRGRRDFRRPHPCATTILSTQVAAICTVGRSATDEVAASPSGGGKPSRSARRAVRRVGMGSTIGVERAAAIAVMTLCLS